MQNLIRINSLKGVQPSTPMKKGGRGAASGGKMSPKYSKAHYAKPSEDSGAKKKRRLIDEEIESASDDEVADSGEERELGNITDMILANFQGRIFGDLLSCT